jgi:4-amino-4-deoxy-L-arabinose transferase-like glycosyltransferase
MTVDTSALAGNARISRDDRGRIVRSSLLVFLAALVVGLAMVFIGFRLQTLVATTFDPYYFGEMGKSVAHGDGFAAFGSLIQRRAPLYPLMIGGIYWLFGEQAALVLIVQCVLLAATCVLVFDIGRRTFNERTGWIAAILCALNPMVLRYVADLQLETLLTFLFTLTVWFSVRFYARPTILGAVLVGLSAGLGSLTKSVVLPWPFVLAASVIAVGVLRHRRVQWSGTPWLALSAMIAATFITIAPWTVRNYIATGGHLVLLSSGTSDAFLRGYVFSEPDYALLRRPPYTDAENQSNELFRGLASAAGTEWQKDDYETDQILNRASAQKLVAEPGEFARKFATGLFTFWYEMTNLPNSLLAGGLALAAWLLAIVGLRRASREGQPAWLLIMPALYLNVCLAALLALGRYSVPILPALLVVSAFGVDTLLRRRAVADARG